MALKVLYTIFLGILIALFVGIGIAAFYTAPTPPEAPAILQYPISSNSSVDLAAQKVAQDQFNQTQKTYQTAYANYNRRVSIISLIAAIVILVVALGMVTKILLISDGLLLGGVLTLIYSIIRGFMGENTIYRFIVVTFGLLIALAIGYVKFIKPDLRQS